MQIRIENGESLKAVQAAAVTTTAPTAKVDYTDDNGLHTTMAVLTGVTAVTLLSGVQPSGRTVNNVSIYNGDTVAQTVTLNHVQGGTTFPITKITLQAGETLVVDQSGIRTLDANGAVKQAAAANVATVLPGPFRQAIGASTAAAGSTTSDAGVLPAATASFYPTTAADDTTGVRIHASDKVDGQTIDIGNGVSNKILKIYPPSGGTINGAAADAAFSTASGKGARVVCLSAASNTWRAS